MGEVAEKTRVPSPDEVWKARTAKGGWTRKQLEKWGVGEWWPGGQSSPTRGWRRELERQYVKQELEAARERRPSRGEVEAERLIQNDTRKEARTMGITKAEDIVGYWVDGRLLFCVGCFDERPELVATGVLTFKQWEQMVGDDVRCDRCKKEPVELKEFVLAR
jgi:hypothetical protein